jgi:hypothetical protein
VPGTGEIAATVARAFAGASRPWPPELLAGFALPAEISSFLAAHGLPVDPAPPLVRFLTRPAPSPRPLGSEPRHLLVGHDASSLLRMQEGSAEILASTIPPWAAWAVTTNPDFLPVVLDVEARRRSGPPRFVNSSVVHLLECLRRYRDRLDELRRVDDEGAVDIASALEEAIWQVDPKALADPQGWWSGVLDRVAEGVC